MNENEKENVGGGVKNLKTKKNNQGKGGDDGPKAKLLWLFFLVMVLLIIGEWAQRHRQHALEIGHLPPLLRRTIYTAIFLMIITLGDFGENRFIYFQF